MHGFNFPFQIGVSGDEPTVAEVFHHEIKEGDLILLASDGLFDNMFDRDLNIIVNTVYKRSKMDIEMMVEIMGNQCYTKSID